MKAMQDAKYVEVETVNVHRKELDTKSIYSSINSVLEQHNNQATAF